MLDEFLGGMGEGKDVPFGLRGGETACLLGGWRCGLILSREVNEQNRTPETLTL